MPRKNAATLDAMKTLYNIALPPSPKSGEMLNPAGCLCQRPARVGENRRHRYRPSNNSDSAAAALSRLSNQYSSSSGPISVSTTWMNHSTGSAMATLGAGVT